MTRKANCTICLQTNLWSVNLQSGQHADIKFKKKSYLEKLSNPNFPSQFDQCPTV